MPTLEASITMTLVPDGDTGASAFEAVADALCDRLEGFAVEGGEELAPGAWRRFRVAVTDARSQVRLVYAEGEAK